MADPNFRLQKGLFIGSQTGFVDAFNYMYENINGLNGGQGIELDKTIDGAWQINADQSTDGGSGGGGSGGGNVEDVTSETYNDGDSIKVVYADGSPDGHIPLSFVDDVSKTTYLSSDALQIQYSSGAQDKYITLPYIEGVTIYGKSVNTTTNTGERKSFTFESASNSNVRFTCNGSTITVGVFYV